MGGNLVYFSLSFVMLLKLYQADFYFINVMIFIVWQMAILQADYTQEKNTARQALELYEQETSNRLNAESQLVQVQVCVVLYERFWEVSGRIVDHCLLNFSIM